MLSVARAEAVVAVTGEGAASAAGELSVVLHPRPDAASDLATIVESLALNTEYSINSNSNRATNSSKPLFPTVRGNKVQKFYFLPPI